MRRDGYSRAYIINSIHDVWVKIDRSSLEGRRPLYMLESGSFIYIDAFGKFRFALGNGIGRTCPGRWWKRIKATEAERLLLKSVWPELLDEALKAGVNNGYN